MTGCSAYACKNRSEQGFLMKVFPRDPVRRAQWEAKVCRANWKATNSSFLCEVHFDVEQWENKRVDGLRKLKWTAVPTIFSFEPPKKLWKVPLKKQYLTSTATAPVANAETHSTIMFPEFEVVKKEVIDEDMEVGVKNEFEVERIIKKEVLIPEEIVIKSEYKMEIPNETNELFSLQKEHESYGIHNVSARNNFRTDWDRTVKTEMAKESNREYHYQSPLVEIRKNRFVGKKKLSCYRCKYKTTSKKRLRNHLYNHNKEKCTNNMDMDQKIFQCSICDYCGAKETLLRLHMYTHMDKKPFQCSICDYGTGIKGHLKTHMYTHMDKKPFQCNICDYSAITKYQVKVHMFTHMDKKPFQCSICNYSGATKHKVKLHMYTHTDLKPYQCSICDYSAARSAYLKKHMFTHTCKKLFQCNKCDYSTAEKCNLDAHMYTHMGKKPFQCCMCNYTAATKRFVKMHMFTHMDKTKFPYNHSDYDGVKSCNLNENILNHMGIITHE